MKNLLGIQPNAFEPVYSEGEHVSDSEDSDLEGNSCSERVGNTDWSACDVCLSLSEREHIICNKWDILEGKT